MRNLLKPFLVLIVLVFGQCAGAAIEVHNFDNNVQRERYQSFIEEMRCPKCQNQNLAGSDSPISADLRRELYEMIKAGKSDQEITSFMVARYGEFILYRPTVSPVTYVLWGAPIVLLIIGCVVLLVILRQRRRLMIEPQSSGLSSDEQARLHKLLDNTPHNNNEEGK